MAVIQKLRNSGIVIGAIVVALIAFVASDAWRKSNSNVDEDQGVIAEIGGQKIKDEAYFAKANVIFNQGLERFQTDEEKNENAEAIRKEALEGAWSQLINEYTIEAAMNKSGVTVTDEDFKEMFLGENPDPVALQIPQFTENGSYNRSAVKKLFKDARKDRQLNKQIIEFTSNVKKQTTMTRWVGYIAKTMHTTTLEKEVEYTKANKNIKADIVTVNFNTIEESKVVLKDADYKEYYNAHKHLYKQAQDQRDIEFVQWSTIPSGADTADASKTAFEKATMYAQATAADTLGNGITGYIAAKSYPKDTVIAAFYKSLSNTAIGTTLGPIYTNGKFIVGKKLQEKVNPNPNVNASHILLSTDPTLPNKTNLGDSNAIKLKAYELLAQINGGANFADIAKQYSVDGSGEKGGDLGNAPANNYVKPFADFCKNNKKGAIGVVKTNFGYHIIRMNEDPSATLVNMRVEQIDILPGAEVTKAADKFSTNFTNKLDYKDANSWNNVVRKLGLTPRVAKDIDMTNKEIVGLAQKADSKQLINWLFNGKVKTGDVSTVFQLSDRYIVAKITSARARGYADWKDVKSKLENEVKKAVKGKMIAEKLANAMKKGIKATELATAVKGKLIPLTNFRANQGFLPELMKDDKVLGTIVGLAKGQISKPIIGVNGVSVVFMVEQGEVKIPKEVSSNTSSMDAYNSPDFVLQRINQAINVKAEVQDYRFRKDLGND